MKLLLVGILFLSSCLSELLSGVYTISNLEHTSNILALSSLQISDNKPRISLSLSDNTQNDMNQWQLTNTSAGWTISNPLTKQYLAPDGNSLRLTPSLPYSWWVTEASNDSFIISAAPNNFAISLKSDKQQSEVELKSVTKELNQAWLLNRIYY